MKKILIPYFVVVVALYFATDLYAEYIVSRNLSNQYVTIATVIVLLLVVFFALYTYKVIIKILKL